MEEEKVTKEARDGIREEATKEVKVGTKDVTKGGGYQ